ncbi:MAG TPA: hypothetical protein VNN77_03450 [candidate division Zixibacteria bacterium]|nr:hypothetical protein [candidate division Zixibacteria bacterium]
MIARKKGKRVLFRTKAAAGAPAVRKAFFCDERAFSIFQPDVLVPHEYLATYQRKFRLQPEKVLMLAVLRDAVDCFQSHLRATQPKRAALHRDAEAWIFDDDRSHLFSFVNICDVLGLDAAYLRQGLKRWKRSRTALREVGKRKVG